MVKAIYFRVSEHDVCRVRVCTHLACDVERRLMSRKRSQESRQTAFTYGEANQLAKESTQEDDPPVSVKSWGGTPAFKARASMTEKATR